MSQYTYKKRAFFGSPEDENGYVSAIVESSEEGSYPLGNYILTLADCKRSLELEFPLASFNLIRRSLKRIDLIADTVNGFRKALKAQAKLIRNYKGEAFKKKKGQFEVVKPKELTEGNSTKTKRSRRRGGRR